MAAQNEVEETLKRLQNHPGVKGVIIVNHDGIPIRTTLEQATTVQYAGLITQLCAKARSAVRELDPHVSRAVRRDIVFIFRIVLFLSMADYLCHRMI